MVENFTKKQIKNMANYEFCYTVHSVIKNNSNALVTIAFSQAQHGNYNEKATSISMLVLDALTQDSIYIRTTNKIDYSNNSIIYQYFLLKDIEIFGIIQKTKSHASGITTYFLNGEPEQVDKYGYQISSALNQLNNKDLSIVDKVLI